MLYTTLGLLAYAERPWRRDPAEIMPDGDIYSAAPEARAETVQSAFEAGVRLFHAAHEREAASLGTSLRTLELRSQIFLSTTDGDALDRCPDMEAGGAEAVTRAIARKCELLGVETLDLFLLYDFRPETHTSARITGALHALDAAREAGTVRWIGATCYGAYDALADVLEAGLPLDAVFVRFNFWDQGAAVRLLPLCRARGITALATQTFSWVGGVPFMRFPNTWRYRNLTKNFYGFTAAQAHLYWVSQQPNVDGVVVSMQTLEQITENISALSIEKVPAGLESLFESFSQAITRTREGWRGLLQDEQWEIRTAAEAYLPGKRR
jgi:aryl-alcohol dehydrogenase-like predicted oxidoreductase